MLVVTAEMYIVAGVQLATGRATVNQAEVRSTKHSRASCSKCSCQFGVLVVWVGTTASTGLCLRVRPAHVT